MFRLVFFFLFSFVCIYSHPEKTSTDVVPIWVTDSSLVYPTPEYVINLGQGANQKEADNDAIEGLAAIFNRSISSNTQGSIDYSLEQRGGKVKVEKEKKLKQDICVSTKITELVGVEIKERWKAKDGTFYALAVIEKKKGARLYREKALACIDDIDKLLDVDDIQKGTFAEYFRVKNSLEKARELQVYKGCLSVLDKEELDSKIKHDDVGYSFTSLKLKTENIAKNIEIFVETSLDTKKLKPHFEKFFSQHGFTLSKNSSARYRLSVQLELSDPLELSKGRLAIRYNLAIELFDTRQNKTLFPFIFDGKETHFDERSVKSKIFKTLEKKAIDEFATSFAKFASEQ